MIIPEGTIKRVHVNQHHIKYNHATQTRERPVFTIKNRGKTYTGWECKVLGESTVVYRPEKPLSCGAKVWIETTAEVHLKNIDMDYDYGDITGNADMEAMKE